MQDAENWIKLYQKVMNKWPHFVIVTNTIFAVFRKKNEKRRAIKSVNIVMPIQLPIAKEQMFSRPRA